MKKLSLLFAFLFSISAFGQTQIKISQVKDLQTSLNAKQATITGATSPWVSSNMASTNMLYVDVSGKIAQTAKAIWDETNGRVQYGTGAATHTLTLGSTTTGYAHYNTVDQVTNYSRAKMYWNGTVFTFAAEKGGTGTLGTFAFNAAVNVNGQVAANSFLIDANNNWFSNKAVFGGSQTASSALARGVYINHTLTAAANNDVLVGVDIAPTFTNGAFTGVKNYALRVAGHIVPSADVTHSIGSSTLNYLTTWTTKLQSANSLLLTSGGNINLSQGATTNYFANWFTGTGNLVLQPASSTITDNGYRLEVVGTSRFIAPVVTTGASTSFTLTNPANTGQTASTEIPSFLYTTTSRQWATGAIATQREFNITAPTYSFVGASTITNAYTLYVAAPVAGTNATITNNYAAGFGGSVIVNGTIYPGNGSSAFDATGIRGFNTGAFSVKATHATGYLNFVNNTTEYGRFFPTTGNYTVQDGGTYTDIPSARLAVNSTTQGALFPRMTTTQKNAISSPAEGLIIYDLTLHKLCVYTGSAWETVTSL